MKWIMAGGTGMIGKALCRLLVEQGHQVWILSRDPQPTRLPPGAKGVLWDGKTPAGWQELVEEADVLVNLAGENLGAARWTAQRKALFLRSRVESGQAIVQAVRNATHRPAVVLQASAIGYYGNTGDTIVDESSSPGNDFLSQLVVEWERTTAPLEDLHVRRVVMRTGVVLASDGDVLNKFKLTFKWFIGGSLGGGQQWVPWIHMDDLVQAMLSLALDETAEGPYNLVGPAPLRNADFGRALGKRMRRPYWINTPVFALRMVLGEMSQLVLEGQRALPARLEQAGYTFEFADLETALRDLI